MPKFTVLIIEDEKNIQTFVGKILKKQDYRVLYADCGKEGLNLIHSQCPDVIILDLGLPDMNGNDIIQEVRTWTSTPIIVISARSAEKEKVLALDQGADDYITKPFEPTELVARVEAVLRRCGKAQGTLAAFDVVLDPAARRVTRSGTPLHLTPREFDLLEVLLRNRGIVLYREVLYERVWGLDAEYDSRTLDLHIQRLRKKLGWKNEIRTVFRVGYVLERGE